MKKIYPLMFIFLFINQANAAKHHHPANFTNSHANNHANNHAPIGVMGDHLHQKN